MVVGENLLLGCRGLLRRRPQSGLPALGRPLLARHRAGHGAGRRARPIVRPGPLAWDGAISFWLRNGAFALFVVVMFFVCARRLHRQAVEEGVAAVSSVDARAGRRADVAATDRRAGKRDVWLVFWIVPAFYTAFGVIFFALARVMPPPRPDVTTDQMVDFFDQHATTIRIGFGVLVLIVGGAGVANGIVVYHMKRMTSARCWPTPTWAAWRSARCRAACWWRSASWPPSSGPIATRS